MLLVNLFGSLTSLDSQTLSGAGEDCFRGLFMRLVSLWWELPPRLDSNTSIWNPGLQQFFVFFYFAWTSTPAQRSTTLMVEHMSSSPQPSAIAARNMVSVMPVRGSGRFSSSADSRARLTSLCIHFVEKLVVKSRLKTNGAL